MNDHTYCKRTCESETQLYQCNLWIISFSKCIYLSAHLSKTHLFEKHSCDGRDKRSNRSYNLTNHKRQIYEGEKRYQCDVCGKVFRHNSTLLNHKLTHTGEKPFPCDVCGKMFRQNSTLIYHKRIHTGERAYPCDVCGKPFTQSSTMKRHRLIHSELIRDISSMN